MLRYKNSEHELWYGGMSQPPWLLAMNGDWMELGDDWNCNGLGRDRMSLPESVAFRKIGFDHKVCVCVCVCRHHQRQARLSIFSAVRHFVSHRHLLR